MAAQAETSIDVLDLALQQGVPDVAMERAEALLLARRDGPPGVRAAVRQALSDALGQTCAAVPITRTALAIADAVERHGAAFPAGTEPAYHDRHHQAEAALAMGWLAGAARRLGLLTPDEAALAVAAMVAHDLLHDGQVHAERGLLERRSADAAAAIAAVEGVAAADIARLRCIILATTWPWQDDEAPGLAGHLAREADLFGSSLPVLGPLLSRLLAQELAAAGQPGAGTVPTHAARVALLQRMPPPSRPACLLGLDRVRITQLDAYVGVAQRLGLPEASAEAGAAMLDTMDPGDAEALLAWSGKGA